MIKTTTYSHTSTDGCGVTTIETTERTYFLGVLVKVVETCIVY